MKTRNWILSAACSAGLAVTLFVACSKESGQADLPPPPRPPQLNLPEQYNAVGIQHNEGLENAFQAIRAAYGVRTRSGETAPMSKEECLAITKQASMDFCKRKNYFGGSDEACLAIIETGQNYSRVATRAAAEVLNPQVEKLMKKIEQAVSDVDISMSGIDPGFKTALDAINEEAGRTLSEAETIAIYAGTSTAYNSCMYWKENHIKWMIALNYPELLMRYTDEQLNDFVFMNYAQTRGWLGDLWIRFGQTWDDISQYFEMWFYSGGQEVILSDEGAATYAVIATIVGTGGLGAIAALESAIIGGLIGSIGTSMEVWLRHNY